MRTHQSRSPRRVFRTVAASALTGTLAVGAAVFPQTVFPQAARAAEPATGSAADTAALQAEAQQIASQVAAANQEADQLDAQYDAATIHYSQLNAQRRTLQKSMARTDAAIASSLHTLKEQALLAYIDGGGPQWTFKSGQAGQDPSLTLAYADVVEQKEKSAERTYKASLVAQTEEEGRLTANAASLANTIGQLRSSKAQADAAVASRQQALSQVKGQLTAAYAQVQAENEAKQEAAERAALAAQGQALPGSTASTPAVAAPAAPATAAPATPDRPSATRAAARPAAPRSQATAHHAAAAPKRTATTHPKTATTHPKPVAKPKPVTTSPPHTVSSGGLAQAPGVSAVLAYARAQIGKPYAWAGAGPNSFDCSGLVMRAWEQAGIYFPHLAQDQYNDTARIPLADLEPGDLVFYGTPSDVFHDGIYIGGGDMIAAPQTGENVKIESIYWSPLLGGGRVTSRS